MPAYVTRKKLQPGAVFNLWMDTTMAWSELDRALRRKRLDRKIVESARDLILQASRRLEIRLPDRRRGHERALSLGRHKKISREPG